MLMLVSCELSIHLFVSCFDSVGRSSLLSRAGKPSVCHGHLITFCEEYLFANIDKLSLLVSEPCLGKGSPDTHVYGRKGTGSLD